VQILILTPVCLAMAIARYGKVGHHFFVLREDENSQRHRGRDLQLRHALLIEMLNLSGINYHESSLSEIPQVLAESEADIAIDFQLCGKLWQLGILPVKKHGWQPRKRVELLSFGADNLLPFSNFRDSLRSPRAFKEISIWRKLFRKIEADSIVVPSHRSGYNRNYLRTKLETISIEDIRSANKEIATRVTSGLGRELLTESTNALLIICPDSNEINIEHICDLVKISREIIADNASGMDILVKPHPSSTVSTELIQEIASRVGIETLNSKLGIDAKQLQATPLEFIFLARKNTYYVGVPSASVAFLKPDRVRLTKVPNRELNSLYMRSYRFFVRFNKFAPPN